MEKFMCPHCGKEIRKSFLNTFFAKLGGKKSRRVLTSEDAKKMVDKRWNKKDKKS